MSQTDTPTFRDLYKRYVTPIYNYVYYRSGKGREVAEDLTSEIFLKALEKFETFDPGTSSFQSWIYTIAHNHLIDHYRVSKQTVRLDKVENILSIEHDLGAQLDKKKLSQHVLLEIQNLPDSYRNILTLKYQSDLSNLEISQIVQKNVGSIRVTLHRAQEALRKNLLSSHIIPDERPQHDTNREVATDPAESKAQP